MSRDHSSPFQLREAAALGVNGDLDAYADPPNRIVWYRSGLTDEEIGEATWHAWQEAMQVPTPVLMRDVPMVGNVD